MAGQRYRVWPQKVDIEGPLGGVETVRARMLLEKRSRNDFGSGPASDQIGQDGGKGPWGGRAEDPTGAAGGDLRGLSEEMKEGLPLMGRHKKEGTRQLVFRSHDDVRVGGALARGNTGTAIGWTMQCAWRRGASWAVEWQWIGSKRGASRATQVRFGTWGGDARMLKLRRDVARLLWTR